jgi:hypothetical protein
MMTVYARTTEFEAESGVPTCVVLPTPGRGRLDHFVIQQVLEGGDDDGYSFRIYDRKGACQNASDLHTLNGEVDDVTSGEGGKCVIQTVGAHNLSPGDTIELKHVTVADQSESEIVHEAAGINVTHTVTAILSEDSVLTDVNFTVNGLGGRWQTTPEVYATDSPVVHQLFPTGTADAETVAASAGGVYVSDEIDKHYENQDNQDVYARRVATALYLEITPAGSGTKSFRINMSLQSLAIL